MSETIYEEIIEESNDKIIEEVIEEFVEPEPIVVVDLIKEQHEVVEDGITYIEESTFRVFSDGSEKLACTSKYPKPSDEPVKPEPTQLDRIEANTAALLGDANVLDVLLGVE